MQNDHTVLEAYTKSLNAWHLELGIAVGALKCFSLSPQVSNLDEHYSDLIYVIQQRLDALVDSCPFP